MINKESAERAVIKIESIMKKESVNEVTIGRKYLPEIFSADLLVISRDDGLPSLKLSTLEYFKTKGILTKYYGNVVKFFKLLVAIPEVMAVAIASKEGLPIASALPPGVDETRIAAITTAMHSLANESVNEMTQGDFDHLYIKGSDGYLLVMQAGPNTILTVSTTNDARLGLILLDCKRTCEKIAKLVDFDS